jgi:GntR family transcriptional repressor for pyruvate dehydrogenase complex
MPRQTLVEKASQQITAYIAAHSLTAGDRLPTEAELAALLGVGRNTVREALKSLASRNILTIRQGAGCFLSEKRGVADDPLGFSTVGDRRKLTQDLMQIRLLIEPEIAALAAQNALPEEAERLAQACAAVEADIAAGRDFAADDRAFHETLALCTHNTVMARLIPIISEGVLCFAVTVGTPEYVQTVRSHRAILEAVRGHRPCDARREMEYHLLFNQNRFNLAGRGSAAPENAPQRSGECP